MTQFVIVPGIWNSDHDHWQSRWERSFGAAAVRIRPRSWDRPARDDWLRAITEAVRSRSEPPVLVAHSLGCLAVGAWVGDASVAREARSAFLVAPPDPDAEAFPAAARGFGFPTARALIPTTVVASDDDPYAAVDRTAAFAAALGATFVPVVGRGHINVASGVGDWPEGRDLLRRCTTAVGSDAGPDVGAAG